MIVVFPDLALRAKEIRAPGPDAGGELLRGRGRCRCCRRRRCRRGGRRRDAELVREVVRLLRRLVEVDGRVADDRTPDFEVERRSDAELALVDRCEDAVARVELRLQRRGRNLRPRRTGPAVQTECRVAHGAPRNRDEVVVSELTCRPVRVAVDVDADAAVQGERGLPRQRDLETERPVGPVLDEHVRDVWSREWVVAGRIRKILGLERRVGAAGQRCGCGEAAQRAEQPERAQEDDRDDGAPGHSRIVVVSWRVVNQKSGAILAAHADVAQLARASACHAEGRGFESLHPLSRRPRIGGRLRWPPSESRRQARRKAGT